MANAKMYWLHTLSPTHIGTGRGVGYIDLPIHRDKVTNWPVIPGSAFKGVWRDWAQHTKQEHIELAFGKASDADNNSNSGALIPTDARLVCLPVRSFRGTFAWCISPLCLDMLKRDLELAGDKTDLPPLKIPNDADLLITQKTVSVLTQGQTVYLEDLDFNATPSSDVDKWADFIAEHVFPENWRGTFRSRFAVLPDTVFDFLTETGTEVVARVKIDDALKTVVEGTLWNEEALPAETILAGFVTCDRVYHGKEQKTIDAKVLLNQFASASLTLQIGGKATVGRGRVRCVFSPVGGGVEP